MRNKKLIKLGALALAAACTFTSVPMPVYAQNGWLKQNNSWIFHMPDGKTALGWVKDNDKWYYMDPVTGLMKTGWVKLGEQWFFLNTVEGAESGSMLTGWNWIDGYCYYFDSKEGTMSAGGKTADGYMVDADGHWTDESGKAYFIKDKGISSKAQTSEKTVVFGRTNSGSGSGGANNSSSNKNEAKKPENKPDNQTDNKKPETDPSAQNKPGTKSDIKPENPSDNGSSQGKKPNEQDHNKPEQEKTDGFITIADYEKANILTIRKNENENLASVQEKIYQKLSNDEQRANIYFLELENQILVVDLNNLLLGSNTAEENESVLSELALTASDRLYYANADSQNLLLEAKEQKIPDSGLKTTLLLFAGNLDISEKMTSQYMLGIPGNRLNGNLVAFEDTKEVAGINFISDNSKAAQGTNGSMLSVKSASNDFALSIDNNSFSFKENDAQTQLYRAIGIYSVAGNLDIVKNTFSGHNIKNAAGSKNAHAMIDCQSRLSGVVNKNKHSRINLNANTFKNIYSSGVTFYASEREAVNIENNYFENIGEDAVRIDAVAVEYPLEHNINLAGNEIKNYGLNENTGYTEGGFGPLGPVNTGESGITINYYDGTQKGSKVNGSWYSNAEKLTGRLKADNNIGLKDENDKNPGVVDSQPIIIGQKDHYIDTAKKINQADSPVIKNHSIVIVKDENGDVTYGRDEEAATSEIVVKDLYITGNSSGVVTLPSTLVVKGNLKVDLPNGFVKLEARVEGLTEINASTVKNSARFTPVSNTPIPRGSASEDYKIQISDIKDDNGNPLQNPPLDIKVTLGKKQLTANDFHYLDGILYIHKEIINELALSEKLSVKISSLTNNLSEVSSQLILVEISNMSGASFEYSTKTFSHMDAEAPVKIKVSNLKNNQGETVDASRTNLAGNVDFLIFGQPQDKSLISVDDDSDTITLSTELLNYLYATKYENTADRNANFGMRHSYEIVINDKSNHIYNAKDTVEFEVIDRSGVDFVFENGMTFTQGNAPAGGITLSIKNVENTRGKKVSSSLTSLKDDKGNLNMNVEPFPVKRDDSDDSELIVVRDENGEYVKEIFNPKYIQIDDEKDTITFTKEYLDKIEPHKDGSTEKGIKTFTFKYMDTSAKVDVRSQKVALHVKLKEKTLSENTEISFKENTLFLDGDKLKFKEGFNTNGLIVAGVLKNIIKHNPRQQLLVLRNNKALRSFDSVNSGDILKVIAENGIKTAEYTLDFTSSQYEKLYKSFDDNLIAEFGASFVIVKSSGAPTIKQFLAAIVPEDGVSMKVVAAKSDSEEYEPVDDATLRSDMILLLSRAGTQYRYSIRLQDGTQYRALLIGNQNYGNPKLNLAGPENDIRMMESLLKRANFGGQRFSTVKTAKNLKKQEFLNNIEKAFAGATDEDVSYLYYSGHGYNVKSSNTSYICTVDTTPDNRTEAEAAASWVSVNELKAALDKVPGTKVIILDCCNAGGFIGKEFVDANSGATPGKSLYSSSEEFINGASEVFESSVLNEAKPVDIESNNKELNYLTDHDYKVLVASSANEYSYESKKTATGKFTLEFVNGAGYKNGELLADADSNGKIGLDEMYTYLMANVESTSHIQVFPHNDSYTLIAGMDARQLNSSTLINIKASAYSFFGGKTPEGKQLGTIKGNLVKINTRLSAKEFMANIEKSYDEQSLTLEAVNGAAYADNDLLRKNDTFLKVVAENGDTSRYPVVVEEFKDNKPDSSVIIKGNATIKVTADDEREIYTISINNSMRMTMFMNTIKNLNRGSSQTFKLLDKNDVPKTDSASIMVENLDRLLVTSKDGSRSVKYTITVLSGSDESIDSEYKLQNGIISSGTQKLTAKTTVAQLKGWLKKNNMDLSDPLTGVYKEGTNPPFGRPKAPNQKLENGDRFIQRSFLGANKIYTIELETENEAPETDKKLSELTPDFGDAFKVENGKIKGNNTKLTTDTKIGDLLSAWQNKEDFDKLIDEEKSGIYSGNTVVISGVPNKSKKGVDDTLGYNYKLILIPLSQRDIHISYEIEIDDEGGNDGPIVTPPIITTPENTAEKSEAAKEGFENTEPENTKAEDTLTNRTEIPDDSQSLE